MKSIGEISVRDAQRAGFREFSSCEGGKQRSRRTSTELPEGEAGPTAPGTSHTAYRPYQVVGKPGRNHGRRTVRRNAWRLNWRKTT